MYRILEYSALFVILILLQFFLFNSLNMGVYVNPLIYIAFIILLPIHTNSFWSLTLALILGLFMDLIMGSYGINTIACLVLGMIRPSILKIILGATEIKELSGSPSPEKFGQGRFFNYCTVMVVLHCLIYFSLETSTFDFYYLTLFRTVVSSMLSIAFIYFCQYIFASRR